MFSSRIIKRGVHDPRPLTLEPLGEVQIPQPGGSAFVALPLGEDISAPAAPLPEGGVQEGEGALPEEAPPAMILEEEAFERIESAYKDGVRDGRREAEEELSHVSEAFAKGLISVSTVRKEMLHESEEDLLKLALMVARRIILREIALDPGILAGMVQGAVELVSECDEVVVRLNPEDHGVVAQSREFAQLVSEKRRITLKGDAAVERAGCLVETVRGNVDARLESQLDEIYRRLMEERSARKDDPVEPH